MLAALIFCSVVLMAGTLLRLRLAVLRQLYLPAAVVAGVLGLLVVQSSRWLPEQTPTDWPDWARAALAWLPGWRAWATGELVDELKGWPGQLIAVVFAGMFLERRSRSWRESLRRAGREGLMVWIIVLGQTAGGLLATWLVVQPLFSVKNSFGMLIETGFAGGHGTAAAMGQVFASESVQLEDGLDLGMFMATVGLVFSVVSGMVYINLAVRRGWTRRTAQLATSSGQPGAGGGGDSRDSASLPTIARGTVRPEVIDPLAWQLLVLALAVAMGLGLERLVLTAAGWATSVLGAKFGGTAVVGAELLGAIESFPRFIYTLFGGLIVRKLFERLSLQQLIDAASIQRLCGIAMEFLVVAAMASLNLTAVARHLWPLSVLLLVAFVWTGFCLLYLSPRLLPRDYWFELGILNYGMSTGTTATGLVLLRVIDPDLDSGAAENYALASPLSSPFVGGGLLTVSLPVLVLERVPIAIAASTALLLVLLLVALGRRLAPREGPSYGVAAAAAGEE